MKGARVVVATAVPLTAVVATAVTEATATMVRVAVSSGSVSAHICNYLQGFSGRNFSVMREYKKSPSSYQKAGNFWPYL